jgi:hypothetical protein
MVPLTLAAMLATAPLVRPAEPPAADPNPNPASLAVPDDTDAKARELVKALGDEHFPAREEAFRDLRELGRLALPAVRDGMETSTVPEVARRCELLYPRAFALDTRARVECFTADADGKYRHDLPGADEFFAITGRTDAARKLYRDLLLSPNRDLVSAVGQADEVAASAVAARRTELNPRAAGGIGVSRGRITQAAALDVIAVLFVETALPDAGGGVGVNSPTYLITSSQLRTALDTDPRKEAMAAVATRWFETRTDPRTLAVSMTAAAALKLPVTVGLAKKILATPNAPPATKAQAATKIAQVGTADDLPVLAPLLADEGVAFNGAIVVNGVRQNQPIQVRDVALAMSLLLAKKDPTEAGFTSRYPNNPADSLKYSYYNFFFDDQDGKADDRRTAAVADWYAWAGTNVKGYPKAPPPADPKKDK